TFASLRQHRPRDTAERRRGRSAWICTGLPNGDVDVAGTTSKSRTVSATSVVVPPGAPHGPVHLLLLAPEPLLRDLLLDDQVLIGGVLLGPPDVETPALVGIGVRGCDAVIAISRHDLERRHRREVALALRAVGGAHLESRRGQQLLGAGRLVAPNAGASRQCDEADGGQRRGGRRSAVPFVGLSRRTLAAEAAWHLSG